MLVKRAFLLNDAFCMENLHLISHEYSIKMFRIARSHGQLQLC